MAYPHIGAMGVPIPLNTVFLKPNIFYKFFLHYQSHFSLLLAMQGQNNANPNGLGT